MTTYDPEPFELLPGPDGCLYDAERELLARARDTLPSTGVIVAGQALAALTHALEHLGRLRRIRLAELGEPGTVLGTTAQAASEAAAAGYARGREEGAAAERARIIAAIRERPGTSLGEDDELVGLIEGLDR